MSVVFEIINTYDVDCLDGRPVTGGKHNFVDRKLAFTGIGIIQY
jgi:hypothetical protein